VCDLETSRIGAPYLYDISNLRVNVKYVWPYLASLPWKLKAVLKYLKSRPACTLARFKRLSYSSKTICLQLDRPHSYYCHVLWHTLPNIQLEVKNCSIPVTIKASVNYIKIWATLAISKTTVKLKEETFDVFCICTDSLQH